MNLHVVVSPFSLQWPYALSEEGAKPFRGDAGYIVDIDAPCEDVFLEGQHHKVRKLTKEEITTFEKRFGRKACASTINSQMARAMLNAARQGATYEPVVVAATIKKNAENAALSAEADALGIPDPDPSEVWVE